MCSLAATANISHIDSLTAFGLISVTLMLLFYALEERSRAFIVAFAACCLMASAYGFLQGAWPFGFVEAIWSIVALRRWQKWREKIQPAPPSPRNVIEFLADLEAIAKPAGRGDYIFPSPDGTPQACVQFIIDSPQALTIHRLWTTQSGQGHGSKLLRTLCNLADKYGVELGKRAADRISAPMN